MALAMRRPIVVGLGLRMRPIQQLRFSAISAHYIQHPTAPKKDIPFLPRILQPTTYIPSWGSRQVPKDPSGKAVLKGSKPWNPATFFIWIFMLIGSNAIQFIRLKQEHATYMRKADARIETLREVVSALKRGEEVDIKKALGTGNKADEAEWDEVMKELEKEDSEWQKKLEEKQAHKEEKIKAGKETRGAIRRERLEREREERANKERQALSEKDFELF